MSKRFLTSMLCVSIFVTATTSGHAQSFSNVTILEGQSAKSVAIAGRAAFGTSFPDSTTLRNTTADVISNNNGKYHVEITVAQKVFAYDVDPVANTANPTRPNPQSSMAPQLPGIYVAALVLSTPAIAQNRNLTKLGSDPDVQVNQPYDVAPDLIFVVYMPKGYKHPRIPVVKSGKVNPPRPLVKPRTTVTIGCDPEVGYSIDVSKKLVSSLRPVC